MEEDEDSMQYDICDTQCRGAARACCAFGARDVDGSRGEHAHKRDARPPPNASAAALMQKVVAQRERAYRAKQLTQCLGAWASEAARLVTAASIVRKSLACHRRALCLQALKHLSWYAVQRQAHRRALRIEEVSS